MAHTRVQRLKVTIKIAATASKALAKFRIISPQQTVSLWTILSQQTVSWSYILKYVFKIAIILPDLNVPTTQSGTWPKNWAYKENNFHRNPTASWLIVFAVNWLATRHTRRERAANEAAPLCLTLWRSIDLEPIKVYVVSRLDDANLIKSKICKQLTINCFSWAVKLMERFAVSNSQTNGEVDTFISWSPSHCSWCKLIV